MPNPNPYIFNRPVNDPAEFFNREDVLRQCWAAITGRGQEKHISVVGGPGCGKTSLLNQLLNKEAQLQWAPSEQIPLLIYLDCLSVPTPEAFFERVSGPLLQRSPASLRREYGDSITDGSDFSRFLADLAERPALLMDNFCVLAQSAEFPIDFFSCLRGIATNLDVPMIVTSCQSLWDCSPLSKLRSEFPNIFRITQLLPFTEETLQAFLAEYGRKSGVSLVPYQKEIEALGGRLPFFVKVACWHYFEVLRDHPGPLSPAEHELVRRRVAEAATPQFQRTWQNLTPEEQRVLKEVARNGKVEAEDLTTSRLRNKGYLLENRLFSLPFADFVLACD